MIFPEQGLLSGATASISQIALIRCELRYFTSMLRVKDYPQVIIANGNITDSMGMASADALGIAVKLSNSIQEIVPFDRNEPYISFLQEYGTTQLSLLKKKIDPESQQTFADNGSFV